jgi:hypothetical protein
MCSHPLGIVFSHGHYMESPLEYPLARGSERPLRKSDCFTLENEDYRVLVQRPKPS